MTRGKSWKHKARSTTPRTSSPQVPRCRGRSAYPPFCHASSEETRSSVCSFRVLRRPACNRSCVGTTRSPWWIDYNHAPPGAGYLHMLFCTFTRGQLGEYYREVGGPHRLLDGRFRRP